MTKVKNFDLLESPLEGTNLIEASAGTGKTYTISGLFLRLILEKKLSVNEILVVTFTVAATEELRDRIRRNLREAIPAFSSGHSEDIFLDSLIKKHKDPADGAKRLYEALQAFDETAIFTIHGFCQRMLRENAFESGSLFDTELIMDQESLKQEIADDFWRKCFYSASPLFVNYVLSNRYSPDKFLGLVGNYTAQPFMKIIPQVAIPETYLQEKEFKEIFVQVRCSWRSSRTEIEEILTNHEGLKKGSYRKASIPIWINYMDEYVASDGNNPVLFDKFDKFTVSGIERATKKNYEPPRHRFFELGEALKEKQEALYRAFDQHLLKLKITLFDYVQKELAKRKQRQNIQSFDDLLIKLRIALEGKRGEELAKAIRTRYRAALIDEFQDTDPIQYAIFKNIFRNDNQILFLIGDPKQAIYSFRSADIFAYLDAVSYVGSKYTLGENWRSNPGLINAINTLFSNKGNPFVYDDIPFKPAVAAKNKSQEFLTINGKSVPAFLLWFLGAGKVDASRLTADKRFIKKSDDTRKLIAMTVGTEISRLLSLGKENKALIGKSPIKEGDIAVLVRTNREASLMQEVLAGLKIPSVLYSTGNLFDSHEAVEMERVLGGIAEPNNERLIKTALTTDILGVSGEELGGLTGNEAAWGMWLRKFSDYHEMWRKHNFIRMFRYLMLKERVRNRLLLFNDGERRLTNLLHLSEVLHQEAIERKLSITGLLKWLSEQRNTDLPRLEEHQLRLESDEYAVKVVTIHKSKGLEYLVVFCPFLWDGSKLRGSQDHFIFHDEDDNRKLTMDLGSERGDENRALAEREMLAENLRLLYVALTRAKSRCYIVWGHFNKAGTSALTYLFHHPGRLEAEKIVDAIESIFQELTDDEIRESLRSVERDARGSVHVQEMLLGGGREYSPPEVVKEELDWRPFSGSIDRTWKVSSFSSLATLQQHDEKQSYRVGTDLPDYDEEVFRGNIIGEEPAGVFAFPRGAKAGTFMHDILEHLDFSEKETALIKKLVVDKLRQYNFEMTWQETLCDMVKKLLSVPLDQSRKNFTLSSVPKKDRLSELEFYFPLQSISSERLKSIFSEYGRMELPAKFPDQIERLNFLPTRGFMKGFIDLIFQFQDSFYLVDWKSNFLGSRVEDYGQEALAEVMNEKFYILQYHIYTVALNQYLRMRLPGYKYKSHFGGIYYLFLRGIDPGKGPEYGIYRARPSEELINELSRNLIAQDTGCRTI